MSRYDLSIYLNFNIRTIRDFKMLFCSAMILTVLMILTISCFVFGRTSFIPSEDNINLGIIGGNSSSIEEHPYQVAIQYNTSFLCSGAALNKRWVVTPASCVYGRDNKLLKIHTKSDEAETGGQVYKVAKIVAHNQFKSDTFDYDFALLKIKKNFKFGNKLKKILIAKKSLPPNTEATISGWGGTIASDGTIQESTVTTLNREECQTIFTDYPVTSTMVCAQNPKAGPCWDDFGNPLVHENELYGQFSWGKDCSELKYPAVYSNIPYVRGWILSTMKKH